jgi:hypothetical protein
LCHRNIENAIGIISKNVISLSKDKFFPIQQASASKHIYFYNRYHTTTLSVLSSKSKLEIQLSEIGIAINALNKVFQH